MPLHDVQISILAAIFALYLRRLAYEIAFSEASKQLHPQLHVLFNNIEASLLLYTGSYSYIHITWYGIW